MLIAAGAWTNKLLDLPNSQLTAKRVPVLWVEAPKDRSFHLGTLPVNFWQIPTEKNLPSPQTYREFYTLPVIDQGAKIKVAFHNGLVDCDPSTLIRKVSPEEIETIKEVISEFLPRLHKNTITSEVCLYSMTPDGHFYLGRKPGSINVFGVALAGHGFKFAPILGEILADLMVDIEPAVDIELFSPNRFARIQKKPFS